MATNPYLDVQGCPVPRLLAPMLRTVLRESRSTMHSCYRGDDAAELLHKHGKHSQAELYDAWLHRRAGFNPANPPGFSTHELRNDGAAYTRWPRGGRIPWWACGIDIADSDVDRFIAAAAKHGWKVARTYPASRSEYHHVNFRRPPIHRRLQARVAARRLS
jgi:hypothetical protein